MAEKIRESFGKEAEKGPGQARLALAAAVVRERPDLKGEPVLFPSMGKSSNTIIFEHEVFKSPLQPEHAEVLQREWDVLTALQGSGLPVPAPTTLGDAATFIGMTRMPGVMMGSGHLAKMPEQDRKAVALEIGTFMARFAKIFSGEKGKLFDTQPAYSLPRMLEGLAATLRDPVVQKPLGDKAPEVLRYASEYLHTLGKKEEIAAHLDFNPGNILVDPVTNRLSGIIDFGIANKVVPEGAFLSLSKYFPASFVEEVAGHFNEQTGRKVELRDIFLFRLSHHLRNLRWALGRDDETTANTYLKEVTDSLEALQKIDKPAPAAHHPCIA